MPSVSMCCLNTSSFYFRQPVSTPCNDDGYRAHALGFGEQINTIHPHLLFLVGRYVACWSHMMAGILVNIGSASDLCPQAITWAMLINQRWGPLPFISQESFSRQWVNRYLIRLHSHLAFKQMAPASKQHQKDSGEWLNADFFWMAVMDGRYMGNPGIIFASMGLGNGLVPNKRQATWPSNSPTLVWAQW